MRAYLTIAGDAYDLCSQNDPCSHREPKGSPSTRSAPHDSPGIFAVGSDPFKR
jgi:hypothetical protein